ncbi:MAG: flavodoxin [Eubacterium sp.]|nr:flavodoxin [Eubacterium sp.]MBR1673892.1 flavodoxin [Eubacterium sp.]
MSKVAVVYWSATGNTAAMAQAVGDAAAAAGSEVTYLGPSEFSSSKLAEYDAVAFGCPAMGAEVLEEEEFEPMFTELESSLKDKKIGLFGSYGWGDGQWMRDWQDRAVAAGAYLVMDGVMANYTPDADAIEKCADLGRALA